MSPKDQALKSKIQLAFGLFTACLMIIQYGVIINNAASKGQTEIAEVIRLSSYLTIWTNLLIPCSLLIPQFFKSSKLAQFFQKSSTQYAILAYILYVGIAFHILLSKVFHPTGANYYLNYFLHYVVPTLYLMYWFFFVEKGTQEIKSSFYWLLYPIVYMIYFLIRGAITNLYPYPFVNVVELGYAVVIRNIVMLTFAYYILGLCLILIDKAIARSQTKNASIKEYTES